MKKLIMVALALLLTVALAGCGEKNDNFLTGQTGNFYEHYMVEEVPEGGYKVTGEAYLDDVLPLVYFDAAEETSLGADLTVIENRGHFELYYVKADGTEMLLAGVNGKELEMPTSWILVLDELSAGESHLEWRTDTSGSALKFELTLPEAEGVNYAMRSAEEQAEWDAMLDALNDQAGIMEQLNEQLGELAKQNGVTITSVPNSDSIILQGMDKQLAAGEPAELLHCAPEEEYLLPIKAALWDLSGDVQLYYVPLDGEEQLLWDSNVQAVSDPPLYFEETWEFVLPEEVDTAEVLPLEVTAVLSPGEGWLEWRSENGADFKINILLEDFDGLGADSLGL